MIVSPNNELDDVEKQMSAHWGNERTWLMFTVSGIFERGRAVWRLFGFRCRGVGEQLCEVGNCEYFATLPIRGCEASVSGLPLPGPVVRPGPSCSLGPKMTGVEPYVMTESTQPLLNSPCGTAC